MEKTPYEEIIPQSLEEINFLDSNLQNCPYHAYKKLRDEAPVWQDPVTGFFVVSRFEDLRDVLLDTESFNNQANSNARNSVNSERATKMKELYETKGWVPAPTLAGRDDPNHKQMRGMFNEAFRPAKIEKMEPFVESTARKLIADFIEDGHCDWMKQFAVPLPLLIIGQQMGGREDDIWQIKAWTDAWVQRLGMMQTEEEERWSVEMEIEAQNYFQKIALLSLVQINS